MFHCSLRKNVFFFELLLLGLSLSHINSIAPNRDFPLIKQLNPELYDNLVFKTQTFTTKSEPIIEDFYGIRILNPWQDYDLKAMGESLNKFNEATGKPLKNYLNKPLVKSVSNDKLIFDIILERDVVGQDFEISAAYRNILDKLTFAWAGKYAERNASIAKDIDLIINLSTSFLSANSKATYDISTSLELLLKEKIKDASLRDETKKQLDDSRLALQSSLGYSTYFAKQTGFSDINCLIGLRKRLEGSCRCKRIDLTTGMLITLPTGVKSDINNVISFNFGQPVSTVGFLFCADFLLKHDFVAGLATAINFGYDAIQNKRVSINEEPSILSPLVSRVTVAYGSTVIFSPYLEWKDLFMENIDIKCAYIYTSHGTDRMFNKEGVPLIASTEVRNASKTLNKKIIYETERNSIWSTRVLDFKLSYRLDNKNNESLLSNPSSLFLSYQVPFSSQNTLNHKKFALGFNVNF